MVTFRNNTDEIILEETIEALNPMETGVSLIISLIMIIFRESHQEEIIIMHQN